MSMSYARRVLNQVDRPLNLPPHGMVDHPSLNPPDPSYNMDTAPVAPPIDWKPTAPVDWDSALPSGDVIYEEPYTSRQIQKACQRLEFRIQQQEQARMSINGKDSIPLRCEVLKAFRPKLPGRAMKFRNAPSFP